MSCSLLSAVVPGRGEYLKMKEFLYCAFMSKSTVAWKSSSVSPGKPTIKSPAIQMPGMVALALSRSSKYPAAV